MDRRDEMYPTLIAHMERQTQFANDISRDMGEVKATLVHVLEEAKRTNGRVTKAEERVAVLENFKWYLSGGAVLAIALLEWFKDKLKLGA